MVRTKSAYPEFEPLEFERASELRDIINRAGRGRQAVVIDPEEEGLTEAEPVDLVSPTEKTNVLVRYQRHY